MIVASFTELFCNSGTIVSVRVQPWYCLPSYLLQFSSAQGVKDGIHETMNNINIKRGLPPKYILKEAIVDPAPPEDQVPTWIWVGALFVSVIVTIVVMVKLFDVVGCSNLFCLIPEQNH